MSQNKPKRTIICATGPINAADRAEVDAFRAWYGAYKDDPANRCECGGMIWRVWAVRNHHTEGAYHCKTCKKAHAEPRMWKEREANQL